jgi:prolyl-tRNA editing enzyme YbaK/EbsC (Cys-tRNA(Pro) deacylase)
MHPSAERVANILCQLGAAGKVVELENPAPTAAAAAAQLGCAVGAIANSLVFAVDDEPVLILTSGAHQVDTSRVGGLLGAERVRRADPEFVRTHTGQVIGGVAPIGHTRPLRTLVDLALQKYPTVWAAAGHPNTVFSTSFDELVRITAGSPAMVALRHDRLRGLAG